MEPIEPRISVEYAENATVVTFTEEKILEDKDIQSLQDSIMSVIEQAEQIDLVLDFCNVQFLSSAVLGLLIRVSKKIYERQGQLGLCNINPKPVLLPTSSGLYTLTGTLGLISVYVASSNVPIITFFCGITPATTANCSFPFIAT